MVELKMKRVQYKVKYPLLFLYSRYLAYQSYHVKYLLYTDTRIDNIMKIDGKSTFD